MADREKTKMPENSTSNATFPILQTYIDTNNPSTVIVNKIQNMRTCHPSHTEVNEKCMPHMCFSLTSQW